jgi:hypothetical protein
VSYKTKHDPGIVFLGIYIEFETYPFKCLHSNIYSNFIYNYLRYPLVGKWTNWHIHTVEYYSVIKEMSSQAMQKTGILNAYCLVKKTSLKRLHSHCYAFNSDIPEEAKL